MTARTSYSFVTTVAVAIAAFCALAVPFVVSFAPNAEAQALRRVEIFEETHDYANLLDGAGESNTVTVLGAALGDGCVASMSVSTVGMTMTCNVTATDTVIVRLQNESTGAVDLASGTQRVFLFRQD